jgi:hypothetical protein
MNRSKRGHASGTSSISLTGDFVMRRQPFLPQFKGQSYALGPNEINERPDFISAIGKCLTLWPFVEHQMALLLAYLMKADNNATVAVFSALRTRRSQRDALNAAQTSLDPPMLRLFEAILSVIQSAGDDRADVAHSNHLDKVIWIESKFHSPWNALVINRQDWGRFAWNREELESHMFLVTVADIEDVHAKIDEAWKLIFGFLSSRERLRHNRCLQEKRRRTIPALMSATSCCGSDRPSASPAKCVNSSFSTATLTSSGVRAFETGAPAVAAPVGAGSARAGVVGLPCC